MKRQHHPEIGEYPPCPYCWGPGRADSSNVGYYGSRRGLRRYRCRRCLKRFTEGKLEKDLARRCPKCKSRGCNSHAGRLHCRKCGFAFKSGGPKDLERNLHILEQRVRALPVPADVKAELLQDAALNVLQFHGCCRHVYLDTPQAVKRVFGDPRMMPFFLRQQKDREEAGELAVNPGCRVIYSDGSWVSTQVEPVRSSNRRF